MLDSKCDTSERVDAESLSPYEAEKKVSVLLALAFFLAPSLGSLSEYLSQDTLKSIVIVFATLAGLLLIFSEWRDRGEKKIKWHPVLLLPLLLVAYAVGSVFWSHAYLATVDFVRWGIFLALTWLSLNVSRQGLFFILARGVHVGAVCAGLWAVLQFWFDVKIFPQGPPPGSTFFNRNFLAEFLVCSIPLTVYLFFRGTRKKEKILVLVSGSVIWLALLMTGTRSAQVALMGLASLSLMCLALSSKLRAYARWRSMLKLSVGTLVMVLGLGLIPAGNQKIIEETGGVAVSALQRGALRSQSMADSKEYSERSFSKRILMWDSTLRMVHANPLSGVGAGAWDVFIPLYQNDSAMELDYYAHNEWLQLVAEYGLAGWAFILGLLGYLVHAGWRTVIRPQDWLPDEVGVRLTALSSLLLLTVVANAGFPWHLASTFALFALCLGCLMATDFKVCNISKVSHWGGCDMAWGVMQSRVAVAIVAATLPMAAYVTFKAMEAERKIIKAVTLAKTVTAYGNPQAPQWQPIRREIEGSASESIAINPHNRFMAAQVADEMGKWGDWPHALPIWESVLSSRPHLLNIALNVARGYLVLGDADKAKNYLDRARAMRPDDMGLRMLDLVWLYQSGQQAQAIRQANQVLDTNCNDVAMLKTVLWLATQAQNQALMQRAEIALQRNAAQVEKNGGVR
jgi:O-antigen ligase